MKILAIETSCDDTGAALIEAGTFGFNVISSVVSSQVKIHKKWGGVVPGLAKREHQKNLPLVFKKVFKEKPDVLAVTAGPGLEPCLWAGINFTKDLAEKMNLPIIPVNHVEAHILANFIDRKPKGIFPAVCLIVSGGHTQLILMKGIGKYKLIGETRDDAAGECFDKVAKILGLGYPGGPIISEKADFFNSQKAKFKVEFPRPMIYQKNYDFSFSGLKTAVLYDFQKRDKKVRKSKDYIDAVCHEVQQAVIDVLLKKTLKAAKDLNAKSVILGGGVSANTELRKQFKKAVFEELSGVEFLSPSLESCTDNAVMVGVAAYFRKDRILNDWKGLEANANLKIGK